jgi:hypothetical protein
MTTVPQSVRPTGKNVLLTVGTSYHATAAWLPHGDDLQQFYTTSMPMLFVRLHTHAGLLDDVAPRRAWLLELHSRPSGSEPVRGTVAVAGASASGQAVEATFQPNGEARVKVLG